LKRRTHSSSKYEKWKISGVYFTYFLIVIFVVAPAIWITTQAFKTMSQIWAWPPVWIPWPGTLENVFKLFTVARFGRALFNSVIVAGSSSLIALSFAAVSAYGFSRFQFRYKYLLLVLLIGIQMVPATANIIPLYFITHKLSLHNTRVGVIILMAGIRIPFSIWILKGFFDKIPISIEESALIDGASRTKVLTQILLPLIIPGLSAAFFVTFLATWNHFILPMIIIGDSAKQVAVIKTYQLLSQEMEYPGLVASAAMLTTFPVLVIFYGFQKLFIGGLTSGYGK